mmetsp:Transcript_89717/g.257049  ORF Transcript_89717/g.257049 Transcript_89717/m.257049 type:complete len:241 (+) Transcript_89717:613-1335(+)
MEASPPWKTHWMHSAQMSRWTALGSAVVAPGLPRAPKGRGFGGRRRCCSCTSSVSVGRWMVRPRRRPRQHPPLARPVGTSSPSRGQLRLAPLPPLRCPPARPAPEATRPPTCRVVGRPGRRVRMSLLQLRRPRPVPQLRQSSWRPSLRRRRQLQTKWRSASNARRKELQRACPLRTRRACTSSWVTSCSTSRMIPRRKSSGPSASRTPRYGRTSWTSEGALNWCSGPASETQVTASRLIT